MQNGCMLFRVQKLLCFMEPNDKLLTQIKLENLAKNLDVSKSEKEFEFENMYNFAIHNNHSNL